MSPQHKRLMLAKARATLCMRKNLREAVDNKEHLRQTAHI
ncbi:hypothetical protein GGQ73_000656 [Rhizobium skierniewicense]|uniref:Uncharacterized protein n=1 Tax=Rhizobium skierniewicense TaxID=984260 RepID=A0A7W6CCI4_9HYPH|nr:hypothetical protein [Rhizobium skierniewicense]